MIEHLSLLNLILLHQLAKLSPVLVSVFHYKQQSIGIRHLGFARTITLYIGKGYLGSTYVAK
jgi:hypothetical protein